MADFANSTPAPDVHPLNGSSRPGAAPRYTPKTTPRPRPQVRPRIDKSTPDYVMRLVPLIRRKDDVTRRYGMLERHQLLLPHAAHLEKLERRMTRRVTRWTRRLMADRSTTSRELWLKADVAGWLDGGIGDELARSVCHDAIALGIETICLPDEIGGNFASYHRGVLEACTAIEALPPGATDADADVHMDRWAEIDPMAMADQPRTFADAIGALAYARREFHQFHIEAAEDLGEEPCRGDKLTLHLLDGAITVLQRVVQEDAAPAGLALAKGRLATIAELADADFEPWAVSDFEPHTNAEWAKLANPNLVSARIAVTLLRKTKAELVEMVRGMPDEGVGSPEHMADWLTDSLGFFTGYHDLIDYGLTRLMCAGAVVAREQGEPEAQPGYDCPVAATIPDRRAVAAYRQWLDMEQRLLGAEMYPEAGADAFRFVPMNTASRDYHMPSGTGASWRDLPSPMSRAEAMCRVLGIDWTTDEARNEQFLPVEPNVAKSEAA
jgi:hypothetical protein